MFKSVKDKVCVFDCEWAVDLALARRMYAIELADAQIQSDQGVLAFVRQQAGATEESPNPFIKTMLCRVISIACVVRDFTKDAKHSLSIWSIADEPEAEMIDLFLNRVGATASLQLVGWNSSGADLPILVQRAIAQGVRAPSFFERPEKPWLGRDFFSDFSDWHIDLMYLLSPYDRRMRPKLDEAAQACGFPGKFDIDGSDVAEMYLQGKIEEIRNYNELDSIATFLIWLRMAYCAGFFTALKYQSELESLKLLLDNPEKPHHQKYLQAWEAM